ncbi:MAG: amino acid kinase family protein [Promethearchaeota archaeon]
MQDYKSQIQIFKIGGNILEHPPDLNNVLNQMRKLKAENKIQKICLIPGGGTLANFVRYLDKELGLNKHDSHWMAIYAMEYNGIQLCNNHEDITPVKNIQEILTSSSIFLHVFLPLNFLKKNDVLPHDWSVTSDSISIYLASVFNLTQCFLIKDVDGILDSNGKLMKEITASRFNEMKALRELASIPSNDTIIKTSRPIDSYSSSLINIHGINCILLNGKTPKKCIYDYFNENIPDSEKVYTRLMPDRKNSHSNK